LGVREIETGGSRTFHACRFNYRVKAGSPYDFSVTNLSRCHKQPNPLKYQDNLVPGRFLLFSGEELSRDHILARTKHTLIPFQPIKMAALCSVAPVLTKAPVVSTGKAANTNSMMVWQPHNNK
jgi:hypothetical protein